MKQTRTMAAIDYVRLNTDPKYCIVFGLTPNKPNGYQADFHLNIGKAAVDSSACVGSTEVEAVRKALADALVKNCEYPKRYAVILDATTKFNEGYELVKDA